MSTRPQRALRGRRRAGLAAGFLAALTLATTLAFAAGLPQTGPGPAPVTRALPYRVHPGAPAPAAQAELLTVSAASRNATVAVAQRWERRDGRWHRIGSPMRAHLGAAGLTWHPSEFRPATPIGSFSLTQAFGAPSNAGHRITRLPYLHIRYGDTWGSNPGNTRTYNRYYNCHCAGGTLYQHRRTYFHYGLVIDYNRSPVVPGAGSGFFLHVTDGGPTAGCVGLSARNVRTLLRWLLPASHPRILIRVTPT